MVVVLALCQPNEVSLCNIVFVSALGSPEMARARYPLFFIIIIIKCAFNCNLKKKKFVPVETITQG